MLTCFAWPCPGAPSPPAASHHLSSHDCPASRRCLRAGHLCQALQQTALPASPSKERLARLTNPKSTNPQAQALISLVQEHARRQQVAGQPPLQPQQQQAAAPPPGMQGLYDTFALSQPPPPPPLLLQRGGRGTPPLPFEPPGRGGGEAAGGARCATPGASSFAGSASGAGSAGAHTTRSEAFRALSSAAARVAGTAQVCSTSLEGLTDALPARHN